MGVSLPVMPASIAKLPRDDRGYPTPFFIPIVDGKPEFRLADPRKIVRCIKEILCWVCGERIDHQATFVAGPMTCINRCSAEPPSHIACAEFAAKACPFLMMPSAKRRKANLPEGVVESGYLFDRNPGVFALWVCKRRQDGYKAFDDGKGGILFEMPPDPLKVFWFSEGRPATREEVQEGIAFAYDHLLGLAKQDGRKAVAELNTLHVQALRFVPK